jgi:hypothetical protein
MSQSGGWVGVQVLGQNHMTRRSRSVAPIPTTCAHPNWASFHASQEKKITITNATIAAAKSIFLTDMARTSAAGVK